MKDNVKKMKRQTTNGETTFERHISYRGLLFKVYKELLKTPIQKRASIHTDGK